MGNSQAISNRGSSAVTVQDARLFAQYNFRPPAFRDTTEANTNLGLDSCGALIFTRTTNTYWLRSCTTPKRWIAVGSGSGYIDSLKRSSDSVYGRINNVFRFQYKDSTGGGGVTSVGSGYGIANSPTTITSTGSVKVDTSTSGLSGKYLRIVDTTAMLSKYLRKTDTASLSNRINLKLSISDTSTMLSPYLRKIDSSRWVSSITRTPGKDSIIFFKNGDRYAIKDSVGTNPPASGYYGAFQDNATQTAAADNVGYPMKLRITDLSNGITITGSDTSRITFANTGIYNLQFSSQFQNTDNAQHDVTIWLRLNGSDVSGSAGFISVPARKSAGTGNEGHGVYSWNYVLDVAAGQYYQIVWSTSNHTNVTMQYYAAGSPPPSCASVIATVTQQAGILAGTGITAINSLTSAAQTMVVDSSNTTFKITSTGTSHTFTIPNASTSGVTRGLISNTQYTTFNNKIGAGDTASMLLPYLRKVDTTAMLSPYLRKIDTASLSSRINLKLSISDTSTMLSKYLRKTDTASLSSRIDAKLAITDTSVFQRKSLASYTFMANNTIATANATAQVFKDTSGTYTGTPTWTGGTAPTTMTNAAFQYTQVGKVVTLRVTMIYTNQGTGNTRVQIPLTSNMPAPNVPSGYSSTADIFSFGSGYFGNVSTSIVAGTTGSSVTYIRGTATGSELIVDRGTSGSGKYVWATITYFTN